MEFLLMSGGWRRLSSLLSIEKMLHEGICIFDAYAFLKLVIFIDILVLGR
jgi:hypothetical protein